MVDLYSQYQHIQTDIDAAIAETIRQSAFINGAAVQRFAEKLAAYVGVKHVIPCANGTDALQITLAALDLPPDAEFIVPSFNYVAAVEMGALMGYRPVFVDSLPGTYLLDPAAVERAITPKTKVLVVVHLFGQCADMDALLAIARKHHLYLIEDNAQAIGASYTSREGWVKSAGTMGHIGTTSFFPSKNLGCMGDGGAIFTNDATLAKAMQRFANHGQEVKYTYQSVGINSRLDTLQAAILEVKLQHLDYYIERRRAAAAYYDEHLQHTHALQLPYRSIQSTHVFHQYTLTLTSTTTTRDGIRQSLQAQGIPTMVYYPNPLHLAQAYRVYGYQAGDFPVAERLSQQVFSLPMHTELSPEQLAFIVETLNKQLA